MLMRKMINNRGVQQREASGTRCGDIIIIPDTKSGFNAVHEGDAYPGWHGGPPKADSLVPLALASEALSAVERR
jgi:hypothetical protein